MLFTYESESPSALLWVGSLLSGNKFKVFIRVNLQENIQRIKQVMGVINEGLLNTSWQNDEGYENLLNTSITESSKEQILIDKIGLTKANANIIDKLCGPLSVWLINKLIERQIEITNSWNDDGVTATKEEALNKLNGGNLLRSYIEDVTGIMDWIRVALYGNVKQVVNRFTDDDTSSTTVKDLTFIELKRKSEEWHKSLEVSQGAINYKENNQILLDFRDKDGNGFYWVDLDTNNSPEECNRMGHCGKSSYGTLYSLRQVIPINNKYKLNKSVLTAAIGGDGIIYQLKGVKNSKPKDVYHQYILPLFYVIDGDDYLIQGFGREYKSEQDFKLSDLPEQTIRDLYQNRPELFSSRHMQRLLDKMGIIELEPIPTGFSLEIKPEDFDDYIDGGTYHTYTNRATGKQTRTSIFVEIMEGDAWSLWNQDGYEDFGSYFQYTIDQPTEDRIWDIVRKMAERDGVELDESLNLEDAIKEVDNDREIRNAIGGAINDADANDYVDYLQKEIKSALEFYGNVYEFNYTGAKIQVDLSSLVNVDEEWVDEIFEDQMNKDGSYNLGGVLDELLSEDHIDKPDFNYDERWYPSPNNNIVNEYVNNRLYDI